MVHGFLDEGPVLGVAEKRGDRRKDKIGEGMRRVGDESNVEAGMEKGWYGGSEKKKEKGVHVSVRELASDR